MPVITTERPCPVCTFPMGSVLREHTFAAISDHPGITSYTVVACEQCGMCYADKIPSVAALDAYYRDVSKYAYGERAGKESLGDRVRLLATAKRIRTILNDHERLLDIGCATGAMLAHLALLRHSAANIMGVDLSPECRAIAKGHGLRVEESTSDHFDVVSLVGVLEHVRDVAGVLRMARERLTRGGRLYIEVPDLLGFTDLMGAPYQELSTEHINYFTPSTLQRILIDLGFAVESSTLGTVTRGDGTLASNLVVVARWEGIEAGERAMFQYLQASRENLEVLAQQIQSATEPYIVWGCGTLARALIAHGAFAHHHGIAFTDNDPRLHGRIIGDHWQILDPATAFAAQLPFLIITERHNPEIAAQITAAGGRVLDLSLVGAT